MLHYGAAFYECLCLPKRYSVLCPVVAFHTAFNDHHSLGYETFIFSIADEKKEHKSLSTLDKKPRFLLGFFCSLHLSIQRTPTGGGRKIRGKNPVTFAQLSLS